MYITIDEMQRLINLIKVKNDVLNTGDYRLINVHEQLIKDYEKTYNITILNDCIYFEDDE